MLFVDLTRFWNEILARPEGPLAFRFVLQPIVALSLAIRDGIRDAKSGRTPYIWTIVRVPAERRARLRDGWHATLRVVVVAALVDIIYQIIVLKAVRPLETVCVALVLAYLPYLLARGPAARIARSATKHN